MQTCINVIHIHKDMYTHMYKYNTYIHKDKYTHMNEYNTYTQKIFTYICINASVFSQF